MTIHICWKKSRYCMSGIQNEWILPDKWHSVVLTRSLARLCVGVGVDVSHVRPELLLHSSKSLFRPCLELERMFILLAYCAYHSDLWVSPGATDQLTERRELAPHLCAFLSCPVQYIQSLFLHSGRPTLSSGRKSTFARLFQAGKAPHYKNLMQSQDSGPGQTQKWIT